jgi:hypothetical protein
VNFSSLQRNVIYLRALDDPNGTSLAAETCQEPGARAKLEQTSDSS